MASARSRSIRHPQNNYTGAERIGASEGSYFTGLDSQPNAPVAMGGPGRRLSQRPAGPVATGVPMTSSATRSDSGHGRVSRESVAEFQDLLQQTNFAANHFESAVPAQPPAHVTVSQRSKTPEARRVRNSLHKPYPHSSTSISGTTNSASTTRSYFNQPPSSSSPYTMASSPPPRPSRNNTSNLHQTDNALPTRDRRMSLPSSPQNSDAQFYSESPQFSQSTLSSNSNPPMRSRSGTQSGKNKKGMLSFMSGMFANYTPFCQLSAAR